MTPLIGHVSDTARWVAVYRAMESERPDALFRDPWARRLAGPQGERIVQGVRGGDAMAWAMIVRTAVLDALVRDAVHRRGVDTVVNLAAGLDTRPWRLDLPPTLRWVDVDLPAVVRYKAEAMHGAAPRCRYEGVAADLTHPLLRQATLAPLGASGRALVITEGLLVYLEPAQVRALATELATHPAFAWWVTDLVSPRLLGILRDHWGRGSAADVAFRFGPAEGPAWFAPFGWRLAEEHLAMDDARRLRREAPGMGWFRFFARLRGRAHYDAVRRMASVIVLERHPVANPGRLE
jgi:methyltransferase (TIGR00027 family)